MNINKTVTIHMSEADVKALVAEYLTKEGYAVSPDDVVLSAKIKYVGYGMNEHEVAYFDECVATVQEV